MEEYKQTGIELINCFKLIRIDEINWPESMDKTTIGLPQSMELNTSSINLQVKYLQILRSILQSHFLSFYN